METMPTISVVIPTFNRRDQLAKVVTPLLDDQAAGEIVVVVDGCDDGSIELLHDWARTESRLVPVFQENAGEGAARQAGAEAASGDIVLFIDDDVVASPGLVAGHLARHLSDNRCLVLGYMPTALPVPRRPGQVATVLYAQDYEATCLRYEQEPGSILDHLWAGNLSLRREDALAIGMKSSGDLRYHADLQFGLRCRTAGLRGEFDRSLSATHTHSRTFERFVTECQDSGEARAVIEADYPDMSDQLNPALGLPRPAQFLFRALAGDRVRPRVLAAMIRIAAASGHWRLWQVETFSARVIRQVQMTFGLRRVRAMRGIE